MSDDISKDMMGDKIIIESQDKSGETKRFTEQMRFTVDEVQDGSQQFILLSQDDDPEFLCLFEITDEQDLQPVTDPSLIAIAQELLTSIEDEGDSLE